MSSDFWPECFVTGVVPADRPNAAVCADALSAWGNCMAGKKPPATFGDVMAVIAMRLNCDGTPEAIMAASRRFLSMPAEQLLEAQAVEQGA